MPIRSTEQRRFQRMRQRPSSLQPLPKHQWAKAHSPRPFSYTQRLTAVREPSRYAAILHLLSLRRPPYVARFVMAVVLNAIELVFWTWFWTNVREKGCERLRPFVAHSDSTTAVMFKSRSVRIGAALLRVTPSAVFSRSVLSAVMSMCQANRVLSVRSVRADTRTKAPLLAWIQPAREWFTAVLTVSRNLNSSHCLAVSVAAGCGQERGGVQAPFALRSLYRGTPQ